MKNLDQCNIEWSSFHLGRGIISVLDPKTELFLKEKALAFKPGSKDGSELCFRIWSKLEFGDHDVFEGFLHGAAFVKQRGMKVLGWIMKINNLQSESRPSLLVYKGKDRGVFIKFECTDKKLVEKIKNDLQLKLKAGICILKLRHKEVRANEIDSEGGAESDSNV